MRGRGDRGDGKKKRPETVGSIIAGVLGDRGLADRVKQAAVIPEWASLVGAQIAKVTTPESITANGTLFVRVTTNAWMNELSLLEPELLRSLNAKGDRSPVRRIRWMLGPVEKAR
jgi:predicted nucleic acid-binding Zn ribbon protein